MNIKNDNYLLSTGQPGKVKSADLASIANGSPPTRGRPPIAACRVEPRTPNLPLPLTVRRRKRTSYPRVKIKSSVQNNENGP